MSKKSKIILLITVFIVILLIPAIGELVKNGGSFPPGFCKFPPIVPPAKPGFSWFVFILMGLFCLFIALVYIVPSWFGFKKSIQSPSVEIKQSKLPFWFWIGLFVNLPTLAILFSKIGTPLYVARYGYIFVFASFLLMVDGWVFKRTGGKSLLYNDPFKLFLLGISSSVSWLFYEYLNFFLLDNWAYPNGEMISKLSFNIYAIAGAATLIPVVFEVYTLISTFEGLKNRYSNGIKINNPVWLRIIFLLLTTVLLYFLSFYPFQLFFFTWVGPSFILAIVLSFVKIWTPFTPVMEGNWTPMLLMCLADFIQGFLWEGVNYFSAFHSPFSSPVPGYWIYSIPYVNVLHIFEMPFLGFWGYIAYGMNNWVWWVFFATLFGVSPDIKNLKYK